MVKRGALGITFIVNLLFLALYAGNMECVAAPVVYNYTGNPFANVNAPYTTGMFVTASIQLDAPLSAGLPFNFTGSPASSTTDITGFSGFHLTMSDGIRTIDSTSWNVLSAFVGTDSGGLISEWEIDLISTDDHLIYSGRISPLTSPFGTQDGVSNAATAMPLAWVTDNPGTWTGPTVVPIPTSFPLLASGLAAAGFFARRRNGKQRKM